MSFECLQEVINDLEKLLENEKGYDVIIYAGENESMKEIKAHSQILSSRSQYFCTALSKENIEKKNGKFIFKKPDTSPQLFKIILRFIYCGKIDFTKLEGRELLKLSLAFNELNIHPLIPRIEEYLINHRSEFLRQNPVEILETVYQHESFTNLWKFYLKEICEEPEMLFNSDKFINLKPPLLELFLKSDALLDKICETPETLFNSDKFINLKAPILELLLKRDDLIMDEIDIWNSLLKWGAAQNPSISQDSTKWNKEEITIMERTLHRFISLVRFYYISPENFVDKIYPLKKLLPKDLVNDLLTFHIVPNRKPNIDVHPPRQLRHHKVDSIIIQPKHFAILASWIDKEENLHYNVKNIPHSFGLLYRASRDGNTAAAFHAKCDNKGATIVIAKITNSELIFGGYNPLFWGSSNGYKSTNGSFIFSFTNRKDFQTAKVGYCNNAAYAVCFNSAYGPVFGNGYDMYCSNCTWGINNPYAYSDIGVQKSNTGGYEIFKADDYEVFQVVKK